MSDLDDRAEQLKGGDNSTPAYTGADTPKKRGRPKGSKNRPKDGTETKQDATAPEPVAGDWRNFVYTPDANGIQATTAMCRVVWYLLSLMLPVRALNDEEALKLGEAADPVMCRWIPVVGMWKYEMAFVMCIVTLYFQTKIEPEKPIARDITDESHVSTAGE